MCHWVVGVVCGERERESEMSTTTAPEEPRVLSNKTAGLSLLLIFLSSIACLLVIFSNFPELTE